MKAVQIATSLTGVYAIDEEGQVRRIERSVDGFWGPWQGTAIAARRIVHGGSVIAIIGPDDRVAALPLTADGVWTTWDRQATDLCSVHVPGRGPTLLVVDRDMAWHAWKASPGAPWSGWAPLGGPVHRLDATVLPEGGLALFGLRDRTVHARWQPSATSPAAVSSCSRSAPTVGSATGGRISRWPGGTRGRISAARSPAFQSPVARGAGSCCARRSSAIRSTRAARS